MTECRISVRHLVEFVLRSGDLASSQFSPSRMEEGAKVHKKLQDQQGRYLQTEVSLKEEFSHGSIRLLVSGRADGLGKDGAFFFIDEIKSCFTESDRPEEDLLHLAQAKFYAYIYAKKKKLDKIRVRVTYYNLRDDSIFSYEHLFEIEELAAFISYVVGFYCDFLEFVASLRRQRDQSIADLNFPFADYRPGQKKMIQDVYRAIRDKKRLFVKAPTGIGKTVSVLFPAIKSLIYQDNDKIFYLTSKGTNKESVFEAMKLLRERKLSIRTVFLTAKEKICPYGKCDMENCQYAKGHFDRIYSAILDILENRREMDLQTIRKYSESHKVCPFEFSLDLSLYADIIVGDYNYVFDPSAYLKRFFEEEQGRYIFLMDEAHNFIDRAREMFSSSICKSQFLSLRRQIREFFNEKPYLPKVFRDMMRVAGTINRDFLMIRGEGPEVFSMTEAPEKLRKDIFAFRELCDLCFSEERQMKQYPFYNELMELYFSCCSFEKVLEFFGENYRTIIRQEKNETQVRLFCLNPKPQIQEALCRCTALIAFSATLTPAIYYVEMIGGKEDSIYLKLPSPFAKEKFKVLIDRSVSTRYAHRKQSLRLIAERIRTAVSPKKGNYIAFFPSYEYMVETFEIFRTLCPDVLTLIQDRGFSEEDRMHFLSCFREDPEELMLAFAVLGGTFSEAVDLKGERLSGVIVVSVGLPKLSFERDLMREYFEQRGMDGFDYAYRYLGMNKVMQAGGRVIRSMDDRGFLLLIDDRFTDPRTNVLIPDEWRHYETVNGTKQLKEILTEFWRG